MSINELKEIFNSNSIVKFKLYSLEYIIERENDRVAIYPVLYSNRKEYYNSIEEALIKFTVYNESIMDNLDRVIIKESL